MEAKWSWFNCRQLGHWAEADDSHLPLRLPEAVQYLYFLHISDLNSIPGGTVKAYMMFDIAVNDDDKCMWASKVWQGIFEDNFPITYLNLHSSINK